MSPDSDRHRLLAKAFVEFMSDGADWGAWEQLVADDCVYVMKGSTHFSGRYEGKPAIIDLNERLAQFMTGDMSFVVHDVIVDDNRAVVTLRGWGTTLAAGARYENEYCWILRFRDSQVIEWIEYMDTAMTDKTVAVELAARRNDGSPDNTAGEHS